MTHRPLLRWPDPRLTTPAAPVTAVTAETRAIWDEMVSAMRAMPGVGLAAPQLGILQRLAVVDSGDGQGITYLANPRILHASVDLRDYEEASPNLPGVSAKVRRPRAVTVAFLDRDGVPREADFVLLRATSVQHQIDHLDGKLYIHRLSKMKRDMLLRKFRKYG
ncbi:peptide deformylase [Jannaschia pagri]|uniref:Peptide deformylase-like n=1 Tax=Jannaschia pagri TaxID=2829797 RepID=A0ABQ4NGZ5_9RHOB|nr:MULTISPECIES: peptide deformylase [unclassified Jannaschia]GIT90196.1 peptide deformylase [Jannaschia sp. AI_61]GIT93698.1 peptide deformylase [Jannaschia sp. AI_62]